MTDHSSLSRNVTMDQSPALPDLGSSFVLPNGVRLKNRLIKAAMSEQLGDRRHDPGSGMENLYRQWAQGGIGLSISGNIMVDRNAIGELRNVVLDAHSDLNAFRRWALAGSSHGTHLWAQLNHPGKQIIKLLCDEPVAPSAISLGSGLEKHFNCPRALTEDGIEKIIAQFATSARLAKVVGFTGVQIHAAHGYLINQFLSPLHNQRSDQWGGSLANRMRFLVRVYQAIRSVVGDAFPVGIKLNSADFMRGGFTEEESLQVVVALGNLGLDQLEISGGTYESPVMVGNQAASTREREAYFLNYAARVREVSTLPLVVTGGFRSGAAMTAALRDAATDFIGLARPLALEPDMPVKLLSEATYRVDLRPLSTGFAALDRIATLDVSWYEHQLQRMARHQLPKPGLSEWLSLGKTLLDFAACARKKRSTQCSTYKR